jgi:uncharacterized membrane protein (UPF0127 family)
MPSSPVRETLTIRTASGEHSFDVEVVRAREQHEKGLMERTDLPANGGMLFLEDREVAKRMWMKGTPLSLDMIFIAGSGVIHRIERRTTPYSEKKIWSNGLVIAVLEIGGGITEKLNINEGDTVLFAD